MTILSDRHPQVPTIELYDVVGTPGGLTGLVSQYLSWHLLQHDEVSGDVLLERRQDNIFSTKEMIILCGTVGRTWLMLKAHRPKKLRH